MTKCLKPDTQIPLPYGDASQVGECSGTGGRMLRNRWAHVVGMGGRILRNTHYKV